MPGLRISGCQKYISVDIDEDHGVLPSAPGLQTSEYFDFFPVLGRQGYLWALGYALLMHFMEFRRTVMDVSVDAPS